LSGWLLDTSVISELAPRRPPISSELADWLEANSASLFLSAMTAAEIEAGIAKRRRSGGAGRADALTAWFGTVVSAYADRILPIDLGVARIAGALADRAIAKGRSPGLADVLIAATAQANGLTVLTRNLRHFEPLDVAARDPFSAVAS
jgi:predicted nucleic acid-binding protein